MPDIEKIQKMLDDSAEAIRVKYGIPNIGGVLVRKNGIQVMHTVKGIKDASKSSSSAGNKMHKDNYFNVGSISKPITGLLIACLVKKGVLGWNTKISDVFTEFKSKAFRDHCGMNDTFIDKKVFELISHTSGLNGNYYYDGVDANGNQLYYGDMDPFRFYPDFMRVGGNSRDEEFQNFESVKHQRYLYAVLNMKKKRYHYDKAHNTGYYNAGKTGYGSAITICVAMVERILNRSWELVMTELLLDPLYPLTMQNGPFPYGEQAHYYDSSQGKYVPNPSWNNELAPYNCKYIVGGINCTVNGMAQYIKYNIPAMNYASTFNVSEYQKPVTDATQGGLFINGSTLNHSGESNESMAFVEIDPAGGFGFAVMTNSNSHNVDSNVKWGPLWELLAKLKDLHAKWATIT